KTSTKEILKTILEQKFKILATKEHQNSEIGNSSCILDELKSEHQVFICEMGAYDKGKIKEVASIARPQIGVVTGINEQHLALFGSMENLMSAEGGLELAENLPQNGVMILNGNNEIIQNTRYKIPAFAKASAGKQNTRYCSTKKETDLWAKNIIIEKEALSFTVCDKAGDSADFKINLVGRHNIENVLLAAAVAKEVGMSLPEIAAACEKIRPEQGAIKLSRKEGGADIIDSSYSANPDGVLTALEHLKLWSGKKVIIMPCLIELGPVAKKAHQKIGRKIGEICDLAIITTKDWFEEIKKSAIEAGIDPENIIFSENLKGILEKIKPFLQPENVILLEGRLPKELLKIILN
ncbi:MAG: UDP-N-acetylmuramoyl-tripeptide--D-alanyl-D-alanine ligase, partial [bacterium]|nr:UDP-N-acetylmuramoyl-tripeptide--D-alanyl-D-alanine ligase [bacterium]